LENVLNEVLGESFFGYNSIDEKNKIIEFEVGDDGYDLESNILVRLSSENEYIKDIDCAINELKKSYPDAADFIDMRHNIVWKTDKREGYIRGINLLEFHEKLSNIAAKLPKLAQENVIKLIENDIESPWFKNAVKLATAKEKLKIILEKMANRCSLSSRFDMDYFLGGLNRVHARFDLDDDNRIIVKPFKINECFFSNDYNNINVHYLSPYHEVINSSFHAFFQLNVKYRNLIRKCNNCLNFYMVQRNLKSKWCSNKCRLEHHNKKRIESGAHAAYKRRKRAEGAKESYYG
jgi:hypothetical protein